MKVASIKDEATSMKFVVSDFLYFKQQIEKQFLDINLPELNGQRYK